MGKLLSLLLVQNATVKCLTDCTVNVGTDISQRSYFILDLLDSRSGFSASVAEMIYLAADLVRAVEL